MDLVRPLAPPPPSWWTGARMVQDRATSSSSARISVQRAPLQDLFSFVSSTPINSRTSLEAALQGTTVHMLEMRLKLLLRFPKSDTEAKTLDHGGLIGFTASTDLNRRHRMTLESTLGSEEGRGLMSAFVSSKFESRMSWGLAISHKVHQSLTFFSRYHNDDNARNNFIIQVVHRLNENITLSPIFSVTTGTHPQAGLSLTHQITETGLLGKHSLQIKGFYSGTGAFSLSIKAQAGQVD